MMESINSWYLNQIARSYDDDFFLFFFFFNETRVHTLSMHEKAEKTGAYQFQIKFKHTFTERDRVKKASHII